MTTLIKRLVGLVMAHEGDYDSVNRNTDGAGASIGIFQWPQRTGGLGQVLRQYHRANPALFVQIFGPSSKELLQKTAAASMEPVDGAQLWQEPWVSRFARAGRQPVFQAVQDRMASDGPFIKAAFTGATALGFVTERSLAVVLDAAVSQGPEFAMGVAREVRQALAGQTLPMNEALEEYLRRSVDHFHSRAKPSPPRSPHLSWRKVGSEWHKYAGQVNLYLNVTRRRKGFIENELLADVVIEPGTEATV